MTTQIVPYQKLKELISSDEIQMQFTNVLGDRAPAFLASLLSTVYTDDNLKKCEPNSIVVAAMKAAVLDLPVDKNIGFAWIIPYGKQANFQMGYKGYIQLALRTNQYQAINAFPIYEGETLIHDRVSGKIAIEGQPTGDTVTHYASYFQLNNGFEHAEVMTVDEIHEHAKRFSKSYARKGSPWQDSFPPMAKKTVLKANLSKYGPLSLGFREALQYDEDNGLSIDERFRTPDVVEGEAQEVEEDLSAWTTPPTNDEQDQSDQSDQSDPFNG